MRDPKHNARTHLDVARICIHLFVTTTLLIFYNQYRIVQVVQFVSPKTKSCMWSTIYLNLILYRTIFLTTIIPQTDHERSKWVSVLHEKELSCPKMSEIKVKQSLLGQLDLWPTYRVV